MKWYEKQAADIAHIKNFYEGKRARANFHVNERVSLAYDINTAGGTIPRTSEGEIVEAAIDGSYVVDFGATGKHHFSAEVAAKALYAIQKSDMRETIRKAMNSRIDESFNPGHRVKDMDGRQYFIEQADVFGRTFQCIDEKGRTRVLSKHEVERVDEEEALPGGNPLALSPGSTVVVRGINPALNNIRARAILPGEAAGIIGQTGILGFAYYPAGQGSTMYRVILQSGGMKDFSMEELSQAGEMMRANESIQEEEGEAPAGPRPVHQIAREIRKSWTKVNYAAKPYLDAMHSLDSAKDNYGADPGDHVINYFLANASTWRGPDAKRIKSELKAHVAAVTGKRR